MQQFLINLNEQFTLFLVLPAIFLLGIYFTWRLRALQVTKLTLSAKLLLEGDKDEPGDISHYQALSAVIAGNLGTGNISGMAVALASGGPGALVWMWIMAFFGSTIQYASCVLGVKYRKKDVEGDWVGGPMYYLQYGLRSPFFAAVFAIVTIIAAVTVGNFAQINSIILPLQKMGMPSVVAGVALAVFVALVTLGGVKRLAKVSSSIVPVMAIVYLLASLSVLGMHYAKVVPALHRMLQEAFSMEALSSGALGFGVLKAMTVGFKRGVFATDAGTGIVPILQSSAKTKHPVIDGLVTLIAPFIVMIMCTTTGLVLMVTGASESSILKSTNMVTYAFSSVLGKQFGSSIVVLCLFLFAYTTVIAWGCCGQRAAEFLIGKKRARLFQYLYLLLIPVGAVVHVDAVWLMADLAISLMLFTNLIAITGLSKEVIASTEEFFLLPEAVRKA
jgi:AGCS family alanine or glycine:cation symporter